MIVSSRNNIEIKLLQHNFSFRQLNWREEFSLKFEGKDPRRTILAQALVTVSLLPISSFEDAYKVIKTLPTPILEKVFIIYKGSLPTSRKFTTLNLFKAPDPLSYMDQVKREELNRETKVEAKLDEVEAKILKSGKNRGGFVPASGGGLDA